MVHFRTFIHAFTVGALAVIGMTIAGAVWCGWLIFAIFLIVWAVHTNDFRQQKRKPRRHLRLVRRDDDA